MSWDIVEKALNLLGGLSGIALLILGVAKLLGKNLLDHWFAKDIERYKSDLDVINKNIQSQLDAKIEVLKIQYANVFSERISIFKNISRDYYKIEERIVKIQAFKNNYPCYEKMDFSKVCKNDSPCDECILNYRDKIIDLRESCLKTNSYLEENNMFFSIEMIGKSAELLTIVVEACNSALDINNEDKNLEAREIIDKIVELDINCFSKLRNELNSMFRLIIGISYYENLNEKI